MTSTVKVKRSSTVGGYYILVPNIMILLSLIVQHWNFRSFTIKCIGVDLKILYGVGVAIIFQENYNFRILYIPNRLNT